MPMAEFSAQFFALRPALRPNEAVLATPLTTSEFPDAVSHRNGRSA